MNRVFQQAAGIVLRELQFQMDRNPGSFSASNLFFAIFNNNYFIDKPRRLRIVFLLCKQAAYFVGHSNRVQDCPAEAVKKRLCIFVLNIFKYIPVYRNLRIGAFEKCNSQQCPDKF